MLDYSDKELAKINMLANFGLAFMAAGLVEFGWWIANQNTANIWFAVFGFILIAVSIILELGCFAWLQSLPISGKSARLQKGGQKLQQEGKG